MCLMQLAVSRLLVTSDTPQADRQTLLCGRPHVVLKVKVSLSLPGRAGLGASRWRSPTCCQLAYRPTHFVKVGSLHRLISSLLYRLCLIHSVLSFIICLWTNILLDLWTHLTCITSNFCNTLLKTYFILSNLKICYHNFAI